MNYKLILVILFLLFHSDYLIKADTIPLIHSSFQIHYGFIIPHSASIRQVSYTNPVGFEFNHGKFHTSFKDWKVFNDYWISGLNVRYFNFDNPEVLGSVLYGSVFAGPLVSHGKKYMFIIIGGAGLSYHNKIYHPIDNPLNQFFSTRISFPLYLSTMFKYRLGERTFITLSGSYNHISNGGFRQPNMGMNFPTLAMGIEHFNIPFPALDNNYRSNTIVGKRKVSVTLQALSSLRVINSTGDFIEKSCFIYGFHMRVSKPLGSLYSLNAGAELIVDGFIRETTLREQTNIDHKRFALTLGQDFTFGKVMFVQYFGFYVYSPYKARDNVYQKYELVYKTPCRLMFGVFLKAHRHFAELMGVTVNFQLMKPK
jgi:hypothetical protein